MSSAAVIEPGEIGGRIRRARLLKGWTQQQFANEASVSMSSVARWEQGTPPPTRELLRIAELLDVNPSEFIEVDAGRQDQLTLIRSELADLRRVIDSRSSWLAEVEEQLQNQTRLLGSLEAMAETLGKALAVNERTLTSLEQTARELADVAEVLHKAASELARATGQSRSA